MPRWGTAQRQLAAPTSGLPKLHAQHPEPVRGLHANPASDFNADDKQTALFCSNLFVCVFIATKFSSARGQILSGPRTASCWWRIPASGWCAGGSRNWGRGGAARKPHLKDVAGLAEAIDAGNCEEAACRMQRTMAASSLVIFTLFGMFPAQERPPRQPMVF